MFISGFKRKITQYPIRVEKLIPYQYYHGLIYHIHDQIDYYQKNTSTISKLYQLKQDLEDNLIQDSLITKSSQIR